MEITSFAACLPRQQLCCSWVVLPRHLFLLLESEGFAGLKARMLERLFLLVDI
jgi:hypothetical protein